MCLPLLIFSCTMKSRSSLLAPAHLGGPGKRAVNGYGGGAFTLQVDASDHSVASVLTQTADDGTEQPVAFASNKLNKTQMAWSVIEKKRLLLRKGKN